MMSDKKYIFGRSRLARELLTAGYIIKETANPYNATKRNWTCDLSQPGSAELIYNYLTENNFTVPSIIIEAVNHAEV